MVIETKQWYTQFQYMTAARTKKKYINKQLCMYVSNVMEKNGF